MAILQPRGSIPSPVLVGLVRGPPPQARWQNLPIFHLVSLCCALLSNHEPVHVHWRVDRGPMEESSAVSI